MVSDPSPWRPLLALAGVGWVLVAGIVVGYLAGAWLDRRWGTEPWMIVAGTLLGATAGFLQLWRAVKQSLK